MFRLILLAIVLSGCTTRKVDASLLRDDSTLSEANQALQRKTVLVDHLFSFSLDDSIHLVLLGRDEDTERPRMLHAIDSRTSASQAFEHYEVSKEEVGGSIVYRSSGPRGTNATLTIPADSAPSLAFPNGDPYSLSAKDISEFFQPESHRIRQNLMQAAIGLEDVDSPVYSSHWKILAPQPYFAKFALKRDENSNAIEPVFLEGRPDGIFATKVTQFSRTGTAITNHSLADGRRVVLNDEFDEGFSFILSPDGTRVDAAKASREDTEAITEALIEFRRASQ